MHIIKRILIWLSSILILRSKRDEYIYLTFDDGPHPENTLKLLAVLDKYNVKATFFMVGKEIEQYPNIAKRIYANGHTLGYHSYDHSHARKKSFKEISYELAHANKLEDRYEIDFNGLYRPPYGALTLSTFLAIVTKGWKVILWSKDSMDSYTDTKTVCQNLSKENLIGGDIILLHDDYTNTPATMDLVLASYNSSKLECRGLA